MREHRLAPTTHTAELQQIHEINVGLAHGYVVTAGSLGIGGAVPADAVLRFLEAVGPPSYPYVFGHFSRPGEPDTARIALHTAHLRAVSTQLRLRRHIWGAGSIPMNAGHRVADH